MQHRIPACEAKGIFIESDEVFEIYVKTTDASEMQINAEVEGENFESILLSTSIENGLWYIQTNRSVGFNPIDDKLAAHKVISVVLNIEMPAYKELWVTSNLASVNAEGRYQFINLNLSGGDCTLFNFLGNGIVNTLRGSIAVDTQHTAIDFLSRNGNENIENKPNGKYHLNLKSVDGNISVSQSE